MTAHPHSVASLAAEKDSGRLGRRHEAVLGALHAADQPLTDREIAEALGFSDLNAVRPRITELVALGLVAEMRPITCPVTGKTVRTCRALHPAEVELARRAASSREMQTQLALP